MLSTVKRMLLVAVAVAPLALAVNTGQAQGKMQDKNPDVRAEGVEQAAPANNKAATQAILAALSTESDGPAGFRMAEAVAMLNSPEALAEIEKTALTWTTPEKLFAAYWTFCGLAKMQNPAADAILAKAVNESKAKEIYIKSAAIEALAYAGRADLCSLLVDTINQWDPEWDKKNQILTLTCVYNAPKLCNGSDVDLRNKLILALANILEKTDVKKDDRIQYFVAKALAQITGEDTYTDPTFWRWWVQMGGKKVEKQHEGPTVAGRDVPKFFKASAVGKRVVFVIDCSGSMMHPVQLPPEMKRPPPPPEKKKEDSPVTGKGSKGGKPGEDDKKEEKKPEIPPPDYSKVVSKLDLAKVELIHCLNHLPEDYKFNVVIYFTDHNLLDQSVKNLIPASRANKDKFIKKVNDLAPLNLTNIHGGLMRGFCINEKGMLDMKVKSNGAWDPECILTGATTMFFLTDGSPTISDDTTNHSEAGISTPLGNGRMVQGGNIIMDIKRMNTFRKVVINTIGIGPHDNRLMQALAEMSGGEYVDRSGVASRG